MSHQDRQIHDPQAPVRAAMRLGQQLVSVPPEQRDIEFYIKAHYLGDFSSLGSGPIRAEEQIAAPLLRG